MSESSILEPQGMIRNALLANSSVMSLINGVYDTVPTNPWGVSESYVSFGPSDMVPQDAECLTGEAHSFQLDVWSRKGGRPSCARVCSRIKAALHYADLSLGDNMLVQIKLDRLQIVRDPDGLTVHGVMVFSVDLEVNDD